MAIHQWQQTYTQEEANAYLDTIIERERDILRQDMARERSSKKEYA